MKYVWVMDVSQQARKRVYSLLERLTAACYRNNRFVFQDSSSEVACD